MRLLDVIGDANRDSAEDAGQEPVDLLVIGAYLVFAEECIHASSRYGQFVDWVDVLVPLIFARSYQLVDLLIGVAEGAVSIVDLLEYQVDQLVQLVADLVHLAKIDDPAQDAESLASRLLFARLGHVAWVDVVLVRQLDVVPYHERRDLEQVRPGLDAVVLGIAHHIHRGTLKNALAKLVLISLVKHADLLRVLVANADHDVLEELFAVVLPLLDSFLSCKRAAHRRLLCLFSWSPSCA